MAKRARPVRSRAVRLRPGLNRGGVLSGGTPGLLDLTDMSLTDVTWSGPPGVGVLDAARCGVTINNIGVELRYSGDTDGSSIATLEYKRSGDVAWRSTLPMWRANQNPDDMYHAGSCLMVDSDTQYDIRVTVSDNGQTAQVTSQVRTRPDPPAPNTLVPNRWLDDSTANANDLGTGTSSGTPVKSLRRAVTLANSAAGDQVWLVRDGNYVAPGVVLTGNGHKITFVADHPAVDLATITHNGAPHAYAQLVGGARSCIEPRASDGGPCMWAPTGATDADLQMGAWTAEGTITSNRIAPWVSTNIVDSASVSRQCWVWTGVPLVGTLAPAHINFGTTRTGRTSICPYWLPQGVVAWPNPGTAYSQGATNTVATWLAEIYAGSGYHWGFWSTTGNVIYARFPDGVNPNSYYGYVTPDYSLTQGQIDAKAFDLNTPDHRFSGLEFRGFANAFQVHAGAHRTIVDRCYFEGCKSTYYNRGTQVALGPSLYSNDTTFERNLLQVRGYWEGNAPTNAYPMPWRFVKQSHKNESGAYGGDGLGRRVVVRNCTAQGGFDFTGYFDTGYDRYSGECHDIYDNLVFEAGDDAFDLSYQKNNVRIYLNRVEYTFTGLSSAPTQSGVVYFFNNIIWRTGMAGNRPDYFGSSFNGLLFKTSGVVPPSKIYVLHNVMWTDAVVNCDGGPAHCAGWTRAGGGIATDVPHFVFRNNIIRGSPTSGTSKQLGTVSDRDPVTNDPLWDSDYNDWSAAAITGLSDRYMSTPTTSPGDSTANYRTFGAVAGVGAHDCLRSATFSGVPDAEFVSATTGDMRLTGSSVLLAAGTPIYPFERPGVDFSGSAPDLGIVGWG